MNERVMQFRIGMFVIVAGLVLTMLIVWFGESPSLFRDHVFITARYAEAPGVNVGVPVRKSGIRIGEVVAIAFDERPDRPDGVLVTISIESKFNLKAGSVPRINRSLIGDVSIDMMPGTGPGPLVTGKTIDQAPIIEGDTAPDPARALAAATEAFQRAGETLASIQDAASGLAAVTKDAQGIGETITTWRATGVRVASAAESIDRVLRDNEENLKPAVASVRVVADKVNHVLDDETQADLKSTADRLARASARLETGLADLQPLLKDLGLAATGTPATNLGQAVFRFNRIAYDVAILTQHLGDGRGQLNTNGTLQKLVTSPELFDNLSRMAAGASDIIAGARPVVTALRSFAEKIARDPSVLARGALQR